MSNVKLAHVTFPDCPLPVQAVQMPDGSVGATLRSLCAALSLDYASQYQRIRRSSALQEALQLITLDTPGGPQPVDVIPAWVIPVWLAGLHIKRLPEAKRALILAFQREAVATIERAFIQPENNTSVPPPPGPSAALRSVWEEGHGFIDHLQVEYEGLRREVQQVREGQQETRDQMAVLQYDQQSLMRRVAALEPSHASPTGGLSAQRLEYIYQRADQASQRYGYSIAFLLAGLTDHFQVKDIYYLPEKDWPAVLQWFESLFE